MGQSIWGDYIWGDGRLAVKHPLISVNSGII